MSEEKKDEISLLKKIGVSDQGVHLLLNAPAEFVDQFDSQNISCLRSQSEAIDFLLNNFDGRESADYIHLFTKSLHELKDSLPKLRKLLKKDGMLWVSWPKKAAKVETDLSDLVVMKAGLAVGLVDVKVVSIDEVWSGLKFVYRVKDR